MSYSAGGTIQANDYNNLAWGGNTTNTYSGTIKNLAIVMGTGIGIRGYGQSVSAIAAVEAAGTVTATQWAGLVHTLNKALGHQSGSGTQLASGSNIGITAGATIAAFANVATGVSTIYDNANLAATNGSTVTGTTFTQSITGGAGTFTQITTRTITFASGDAARYFFNAGGKLNWVCSATNNNSTLRSADLVTSWGTNQTGGTILGSGAVPRTGTGGTQSSNVTTQGYWASSTTAAVVSQIASNNYRYEYNQDHTNVRIATNGVQGASGDVGSIVYLTFGTRKTTVFEGQNDLVDVTLSTRVDVVLPETTFLANTWGVIGVT